MFELSCLNFSSGCPQKHYWSYQFYKRKLKTINLHPIFLYLFLKVSLLLVFGSSMVCLLLDPACQNINTEHHCYVMDPSCPHYVPDEDTGHHNIINPAWIIIAVSVLVVLIIVNACFFIFPKIHKKLTRGMIRLFYFNHNAVSKCYFKIFVSVNRRKKIQRFITKYLS